VAVAGIGLVVLARSGLFKHGASAVSASDSPSESGADDVRALRDELTRLKSQVGRVEAANGALAAELARKGAPATTAEKRSHPILTPEDMEAKRADAALARRAQAKFLETAMAKEKADRTWATAMEG